jgi:hypothetical protein
VQKVSAGMDVNEIDSCLRKVEAGSAVPALVVMVIFEWNDKKKMSVR